MSRPRDISGATGEARAERGVLGASAAFVIFWVWWSHKDFQDDVLAPLRCTLDFGLRVKMSVTLAVVQQKYIYRKERKPCTLKGEGITRGSMLFFSRTHTSHPCSHRQ